MTNLDVSRKSGIIFYLEEISPKGCTSAGDGHLSFVIMEMDLFVSIPVARD